MGYKVSVNSFKHGGLNFGERRWFPPFLLYRASLLASDIWSDLAAWHSGCLPTVLPPKSHRKFFRISGNFSAADEFLNRCCQILFQNSMEVPSNGHRAYCCACFSSATADHPREYQRRRHRRTRRLAQTSQNIAERARRLEFPDFAVCSRIDCCGGGSPSKRQPCASCR